MNTKNTKRKYIIGGVILIIIAITSFFVFRKSDSGITPVIVGKTDIVQTVLASGNTKAINTVDLGFETSGKVLQAYVKVGDRVTTGQTLIELDSSELQANLLKAQADLAEELAVKETDSIAVNDAIQNAKVEIFDAYTKADNVVRETLDQFFENPGGNIDTNFKPYVQDGSTSYFFTVPFNVKTDINIKRKEIEQKRLIWQNHLNNLTKNNTEELLSESEINLQYIGDFVDQVSEIIFALMPTQSAYATVVSGYKSDVSSARTIINTSLSNLNSAREKINTTKAGEVSNFPTGAISAQQARKLQFEAQIKNIQSQIAKRRIVASFDGMVTKQDVEKGEIVSAGQTILSIISDNKLEIESNISEVNISKIAIGNSVEITFDAFQGEKFTGTVSYIDPGETLMDGVVNYKIKVALSNIDSKIKSGLTVNLNIETSKKSGVVSVPLYAVKTRSDGSYVQKIIGDTTKEVPVVTGIVGQDGMVEIVSGLDVGDVVGVGETTSGN